MLLRRLAKPKHRPPLRTLLTMAAAAVSTTPPVVAAYPIGTPGTAWGPVERSAWRAGTKVQRSYADEVVAKIDALRGDFDVEKYGELDYEVEGGGAALPLFAVKTRGWDKAKPTVRKKTHDFSTECFVWPLPCTSHQSQTYKEHHRHKIKTLLLHDIQTFQAHMHPLSTH